METSLFNVESALSVSNAAGCTSTVNTTSRQLHRFSHDRYRVSLRIIVHAQSWRSRKYQAAAHQLVSPTEQAATILKVANHLSGPSLREEYLLVAADLLLSAKEKGNPGSLDSFMALMLAASERAAQHASFQSAKRFLDGYDSEFL